MQALVQPFLIWQRHLLTMCLILCPSALLTLSIRWLKDETTNKDFFIDIHNLPFAKI